MILATTALGPAATTLACALLALGTTLAMIAAVLRSPWARHLLDRPNARSLHTTAVPRIGGIGIAAGLAVAAVTLWPDLPTPLRHALAGYAVLAAVSWIDDVRSLPAAPRLLAHLAVAGAWCHGFGMPAAWLLAGALAVAWAANLYNFMDGADGLAGGMTAIGFSALAAGLALAGAWAAAALAAAVAGAAAGFLRYNFHPARVFLGDSGSVPLGFLAAALSLHGWQSGAWSPAFPLMVFLPFWLDASVTLARRTLRGERPWEAHREHVYQLAVRGGAGHRTVALRWYAAMIACSAAALVSREASTGVQASILCALAGTAVLAARRIERGFRRTTDH